MSCINYKLFKIYDMGNLLTKQQPSYRKCIRPMGLKVHQKVSSESYLHKMAFMWVS